MIFFGKRLPSDDDGSFMRNPFDPSISPLESPDSHLSIRFFRVKNGFELKKLRSDEVWAFLALPKNITFQKKIMICLQA